MRRMVSGEMPRTSPSPCSLRASSAESKVASESEQYSQVFRRPTCSRAMRLPVAIHLAQTRQRLRGAPIQRTSLGPCRDDRYHAYSLCTNPDLRPFHTASVCQTIIEQHHRQVGVQIAPRERSTFWFTLPLARAYTWHPQAGFCSHPRDMISCPIQYGEGKS